MSDYEFLIRGILEAGQLYYWWGLNYLRKAVRKGHLSVEQARAIWLRVAGDNRVTRHDFDSKFRKEKDTEKDQLADTD